MIIEILILGLIYLTLGLILNRILSIRKLEPVKSEALNNKIIQTKIKEGKMLKKNLIAVFVWGLLFTFVTSINAQEKQIEKKENKMIMEDGDMEKCMDKIAADSTMRMQMMDHKKDDKEAMMQMCKSMMDNPEMNKKMMKMMGSSMNGEMMRNGKMMKDCKMMKDNKIMNDSTKTIDRSEHESHRQ